MFVRENRHAPELSGENCYAKLRYAKQLLKKIHLVMLAHLCSLTKRYFQFHTENPNESTVRNCSNRRRKTSRQTRIRSTFRQSLMASVGESQVVEKTPGRYLSITELRLLWVAIIMWCCCNCSCPPYVQSEASSPSFSRTVSGAHDASGNQLYLSVILPDID